jgi:hypothetical protein
MNNIYSYKQKGQLYFWEYTLNAKNYPGFHMSWASDGKSSFIEFLELLRQSPPGTYRTLKLDAPTQSVLGVPNNRQQKVVTSTKLKVELTEDGKSSIEVDDDSISLKLTYFQIDEMLRLLPDVKSQNELSIRINKTNMVSFWW